MENNCCYFFYIEQPEQISEADFSDFLLQLPSIFKKKSMNTNIGNLRKIHC